MDFSRKLMKRRGMCKRITEINIFGSASPEVAARSRMRGRRVAPFGWSAVSPEADTLALFAEALEATDSARYPYDANRIRWNMELSDPYTTEEYLAVKKRARFFESVPDAVFAAADYKTLGSFMNDLTDPEAALRRWSGKWSGRGA